MKDNISNHKDKVFKWISITVLIGIILACIYILTNALFGTDNSNKNITENSLDSVDNTSENPSRDSSVIREQRIKIPEIKISQTELSNNNTRKSCWTLVDGVVYDATYFLSRSQRGRRSEKLSLEEKDICGKDSTQILKQNPNNNPVTVDESGQFSIYSNPVGRISN